MREEDKAIDDLPNLSISAGERLAGRRAAKSPSLKKTKVKAASHAIKSASPMNGLPWLLLALLLFVLAGGAVWQYRVMQHELAVAHDNLKAVEKKLSQVTGEISATGATLDQSGLAIRAELKEVNSEIRKLWDVSNKRNKKWILINKDNVVKALKQSKEAQGIASDAGRKIDDINTQLSGASNQVSQLDQQLKALTKEQAVTQSELATHQENMNQQMVDLKALVAAQKKHIADLTRNVNDQQEAVKAVDSFRVQVNRKLQQLEETVRDLTQPPGEGLNIQ